MNRETVIISTLERLNERIKRLENKNTVNGRIGVFLGDPTEDFAREIIQRARSFVTDDYHLEPNEINELSYENMYYSYPSVDEVKELEAFIRSHAHEHGKERLYSELQKQLDSMSKNFKSFVMSEVVYAIKTAFRAAYGITTRTPPQRAARPAHAAGRG